MSVSQEKIERLKVILVSAAREGDRIVLDDDEYTTIRRELLNDEEQRKLLPKFIQVCSSLREIRQAMQDVSANWKGREQTIRDGLADLLNGSASLPRDSFAEVVATTDISNLATLPQDIQQKGKEGADCFVYLFCIENSIREFIIQVAAGKSIKTSKPVQAKIEQRKNAEATRKYLPVRGNSDVYYCDFIELADIVKLNWDIFSSHFPGKSEHWFTAMMDELYAVRLLISHNSTVGEKELKQLDVFYRILMSYLKLAK